jgi:integrase
VRSASGYWQTQGWLARDPTHLLRRRRPPPDRTRAVSRAELEPLLTRVDLPLREKVLWRLLYETAARVPLAAADLDPASGQARLSYRRAAELFAHYTGGWTLHQLRHSALTHAAEAGANTATLLAYSGHTAVASLARYARVSPDALAHWQAGRDLPTRRR